MDAQCGTTKYSLIENIPELYSSHTSLYTTCNVTWQYCTASFILKNSVILLCFIEKLLKCLKCISHAPHHVSPPYPQHCLSWRIQFVMDKAFSFYSMLEFCLFCFSVTFLFFLIQLWIDQIRILDMTGWLGEQPR